jgi:hypothetical protein
MRIFITLIAVCGLMLGGCSVYNHAGPNAIKEHSVGDREGRAEAYFPHRKDLQVLLQSVREYKQLPQPPQRIRPEFPPQNQAGSIAAGDYRLQLAYIVEVDGSVREVVVVLSSGVKPVDDMYVESVRRQRFYPAELNGKKYPMALIETINYKDIVRP